MQLSHDHAGASKSAGLLLLLSLCLNLALATAAVYLLKRPPARPSPPASITHLSVVTAQARKADVTDLPGPVTWVTNQFHWRQVESTNYDEYVANLRAIGCPEKTIRDIILADVEKHYQAAQLTLSRAQERFWSGGRQRRLAERARATSFRALDEEKKELIRRLLGIEWVTDQNLFRRDDFEEQALARFILGPLPEETFRRVLAIIEKNESQQDEIRTRASGIMTDQDTADLKARRQALKKELSEVLTPEQLDEMCARGSAIEPFGGSTLVDAMELTPVEARQIALARFRTEDSSRVFDFGEAEENSDPAAREMQFTNAVAGLLGPKRFEEFQRAQDDEFQTLFKLGKANGLPKETAIKVYDIRQLTVDEVAHVRQDSTLDESARRQRFEEMQSALQKEVPGLLGAKAYGEYLRHDGAWITNVTKL